VKCEFGGIDVTPPILYLATRWKLVVKLNPGRLTSGTDTGTHFTGGYLDPTCGHDILEKE
jgi:hypothetical protein